MYHTRYMYESLNITNIQKNIENIMFDLLLSSILHYRYIVVLSLRFLLMDKSDMKNHLNMLHNYNYMLHIQLLLGHSNRHCRDKLMMMLYNYELMGNLNIY